MEEHHRRRTTTTTAATFDFNQANEREWETPHLFTVANENIIRSTAPVTTITTQSIQSSTRDHNVPKETEKMSTDLPWNYEVHTTHEGKTETTQVFNPVEVPITSQQMNLLSTSITNDKESPMKEMKVEIEKIPNYLMKRNKSLQQMIHHMQSTSISIDREEVRKIAVLIYKIMVIQTYHLLWTAYLKSGQDQLITPSQEQLFYSTTIPIWPKEIKILLPLDDHTNANEIYCNFVNEHLHILDQQLKQNQLEMNRKANNFHGYTLTIQTMIETYVEQHLADCRTKIEHQIELIYYDYHIRALKLGYFRHHPNAYQEQLMKQLCQSKYQQETTEQEYNLLKQQINYYNSPDQSFECSPIAQSTLIDSIQDPNVRQELFNQYKEVAMQSRANLFDLYLKTAETERDEYRKKHANCLEKMWSDQQSLNNKQKVSPVLLQLIDQRCKKISERIKCVYKYKAQLAIAKNSNQ